MAEDSGGLVLTGALTDYKDIISEILARLPVKCLMRFRCVSKPWRALIADSFFVKKHLRYAETGIGCKTNSKLLLSLSPPQSIDYEALKDLDEYGGHPQFARTELDFPARISDYPEPRIAILGSCNGLVCLLVVELGLVLWNPCTRESNLLPGPPYERVPHTNCKDPFHFYGFGYDSTTDGYKCVFLETMNHWENEAPIHHLALKTGSWRSGTYLIDGVVDGQGLLFNESLHWFVYDYTFIMSYNLAEEKFEEVVPLPDEHLFSDILIFRNCLCAYRLEEDPKFSSVWMMNQFGVKESWTQIMKFSLDKVAQLLRPLCILENGEILMYKSSVGNQNRSVMILFNQNTLRTVFEADLKYGAVIYRETLVSPVIASIADIPV